MIEVKLACDSVMVISKQGRVDGKTEQEVGESEGSERGGEEQELRRGTTGAKIRKLKKCRPALERNRKLPMSAYSVLRHNHRSFGRTSDCLVTQNDRNVGPVPSPIIPHRPSLLSVINRICSLSPIRSHILTRPPTHPPSPLPRYFSGQVSV